MLKTCSRYLLAISLATAWVATALLRGIESPVLSSETVAMALIIPLAIWAAVRAPRPGSGRWRFVLFAAVPVLLLIVGAVFSSDPRTALLGGAPLWQGSFFWVAMLGWFAATVLGARRDDLVAVTSTLAIGGAVLAVWAIAELTGLVPTYDPSVGRAMALFENPMGLGQTLTVTMACTVALFARRQPTHSWVTVAALASLVAQLAVLVSIAAHSAIAGVLIGIPVFGIMQPHETRFYRFTRATSAAMLVTFAFAVANLSLAATGLFGPQVFARLDSLTTGRLAIWLSATSRVAGAPLLGTGAGTYDTINAWSVLPDGRIDFWTAYDPHGLLYQWLLGGGLVSALTLGLAAAAVALQLYRIGRSPWATAPVRWLIAGAAACFVAMLTSWASPLAALSVTVLVGCLIASSSKPVEAAAYEQKQRFHLAIPILAVAAAVTALIFAITPELIAQKDLNEPKFSSQQVIEAFERGASQTHDAYYLDGAFSVMSRDPSLPDDEVLGAVRRYANEADHPEAEAHGHVELPLLAIEIIWVRRDSLSAQEMWTLTQTYAERGRAIDPTLGVWDYALARAATYTGATDPDRYVRAALTHPHSGVSNALLREWTGGSTAP